MRLSRYEQFWLPERIIHHLRKPDKPDFESQLRVMASDQNIRRELNNIEQEWFRESIRQISVFPLLKADS